jgi:hypothetical protein
LGLRLGSKKKSGLRAAFLLRMAHLTNHRHACARRKNLRCARPALCFGRFGAIEMAIHLGDVAGRTPAEIGAIADALGLLRRGPDPENGKGVWLDPVTGEQRILSHPDGDHMHVNDSTGQRLDINGNPAEEDSAAAHLPIGK